MDHASWPMVALALIAALPGLLATIAALRAAELSRQNKTALAESATKVAEVHTLVNSRMTEIQSKLEAALREIGELKGEPPLSVADAPAIKAPPTFSDTA